MPKRTIVGTMGAATLAAVASALVQAGPGQAGAGGISVPLPGSAQSGAVVAEHHYRLAARIRPLLVFWIGRDNVGGARIVWRRGEGGERGFEMLIGSDPLRAPRSINRWGYISENGAASGVQMTGVMKESNEASIDEAKSRLENEQKEGYVFKAITALVTGSQADATVTLARSPRDFTYKELPQLLDFVGAHAEQTRRRETRLPAGTRPGFLTAAAELVHRTVSEYQRLHRVPGGRDALDYVYFGNFYTLSRQSVELLDRATFDERQYSKLIRADFEVLNRKDGSKERFELVFGTDGTLAEVPVFITYQPRWWFKAELVLDEREKI